MCSTCDITQHNTATLIIGRNQTLRGPGVLRPDPFNIIANYRRDLTYGTHTRCFVVAVRRLSSNVTLKIYHTMRHEYVE